MPWCLAAIEGLALLGLVPGALPPAPSSIVLLPTAQVAGAVVLLGDVAQVMPLEAAQALAALDLGPAPGPGVARTITAGYVRVRLRRAGVNLATTVFTGEQTTVTSVGVSTPEEGGLFSARSVPRIAEPSAEVKPGAKVTLFVRAGGLQIAAQAEALRPCGVGHDGLFRVCETRATVRARLVDHETAEVLR